MRIARYAGTRNNDQPAMMSALVRFSIRFHGVIIALGLPDCRLWPI